MNKPTYLVYVLYDVRIIFSLNKLGHPLQVYNFFKMVSVLWSLRWNQFPLCPLTLSFLNCCTCCPKMSHSGKHHVSCLWWNPSSKHKLTLVSSLLLCDICIHLCAQTRNPVITGSISIKPSFVDNRQILRVSILWAMGLWVSVECTQDKWYYNTMRYWTFHCDDIFTLQKQWWAKFLASPLKWEHCHHTSWRSSQYTIHRHVANV